MWTTIDNCVGCSTIFGNCMGTACPNHKRRVRVCDACECEDEHLYRYKNKDYCLECLLWEIGAEEIDQDDSEEEGD